MKSVYLHTFIKRIRDDITVRNNIEYETLGNYLKQAKCFLLSQRGKSIRDTAMVMSRDDDMIAYLAYQFMKSDADFIPGKGNSITTHRHNSGVWFIKNVISHNLKAIKHNTRSLHFEIEGELNNVDMYSTLPSSQKSPDIIAEENEKLSKIHSLMEIDTISERDRQICKEYYINGFTMKEIANQEDISKQRVDQILKNSVVKIRQHIKKYDQNYWQDELTVMEKMWK